MCNCNNFHRVVTVTNTGTTIEFTFTDSENIGNMESFDIIVKKPVSALVTGEPIEVTGVVNGDVIPLKNAFGLPLMSNVVPWGCTKGRYVIDSSGTTPETYIILKTPCYA